MPDLQLQPQVTHRHVRTLGNTQLLHAISEGNKAYHHRQYGLALSAYARIVEFSQESYPRK